MAAVEVTITGVLYDKLARTTQQVVLIGEASLTGLGIGGGPIIPPPTTTPPSPGVPTHPIMLPGMPGWGDPHPSHPIYYPPGTWGGSGQPFPTPPIVIPPEPPTGMPPGQPPIMMPPAAGVPVHGTMVWVEGRGYVFVPDSMKPEPPTEPEPESKS